MGLRYANSIIAVSNKEKTFLSKHISNPEKIFVIWEPVDFLPEYKEPENHKELVCGYIGNSLSWQGLDFVISVAKDLQNENIRFKLAGFDFSDNKRFPKLKNVEYIGRVERIAVAGFLQSCNLLLSPRLDTMATRMQFPHKLSEYMAAGRPVIVSDTSDQKEVVMSAECGFGLKKIDTESLVKAIKMFETLPEKDKNQLGENARTFAENNFFIDSFKEKLKMVYSQNK